METKDTVITLAAALVVGVAIGAAYDHFFGKREVRVIEATTETLDKD